MAKAMQHRTIILDVIENGPYNFQAVVRARLWSTYFEPKITKAGAIVAANNYIRKFNLIIANRNKVSKNFYNVQKGE